MAIDHHELLFYDKSINQSVYFISCKEKTKAEKNSDNTTWGDSHLNYGSAKICKTIHAYSLENVVSAEKNVLYGLHKQFIQNNASEKLYKYARMRILNGKEVQIHYILIRGTV